MSVSKEEIAKRVLSNGLQSWGQSMGDRAKAWQDAFDFMNLSAVLCVGKSSNSFVLNGADAGRAKEFVEEVKANFPLGKFEWEQEMIEECLERYIKT